MDLANLRLKTLGPDSISYVGRAVCVDMKGSNTLVVPAGEGLDTDRMRAVPGAKYRRSTDQWEAPATPGQLAVLHRVFNGRLNLSEDVLELIQRISSWRERQESVREGQHVRGDLSSHLYDFQKTGVTFLLNAGCALLGDQQGTGKTIQTIEWMRLLSNESSNHLVVVPNSMKHKWASEVCKFWPEAMPFVIDGNAPKRRKIINEAKEHDGPTIFIINYEGLVTHSCLAPWGGKTLTDKQREPKDLNDLSWMTVALDEAHKIKGPGSLRTMAAKQMGAQAQYRLAMTGTPLVNNPDDLWSIMNFVMPEEYGSRTQFRNRYCEVRTGWHGGMENLGLRGDRREEFDEVFCPRFIRRTLKEAVKDIPDMLPVQHRPCALSNKQKKVYKQLAEELIALIDDELLTASNPLSLATRLRQAASATPVVENGEVVALGKDSSKLNAIYDILEEDPGEPLVVYAESRKLLEFFSYELENMGLRVGMITGGVGPAMRSRYVQMFQDGELDIILLNDAGAEGLTLTRASKIVLAQQSWSHAVNEQVMFRIWRIGQEREVLPIVLYAPETVDEVVMAVDRDKEARLQDLVRDPKFWHKAVYGG